MLNLGHLISSYSQLLAEACVLTESSYALARNASQDTFQQFLGEVGRSPLLKREYVIFTNLQQQGLEPGLVREYVEANLRQLDGHTAAELSQAHLLLERFAPTTEPTPLDQAIQTLITETVAARGHQRVNAYYQALGVVTESLGRPAVGHGVEVPVSEDGFTLPQLLSGAVGPLKETLEQLTEAERHVLLVVTGNDEPAKQALFEDYHRQASALLADYAGTPGHERLQNMRYAPETVNQEIMDLHELLQPD